MIPATVFDIAFTGTRRGLTPPQRAALRGLLQEHWTATTTLHLGDAIGADDECRALARTLHYRLHGHPSTAKDQRAFGTFDLLDDPMPPLDRNKVMVNQSSLLLACPGKQVEELRSGTWATIRHARKRGVRTLIVWPDGTISGSPRE